MPDLIGDLITKHLRRHPFEGVSFCLCLWLNSLAVSPSRTDRQRIAFKAA